MKFGLEHGVAVVTGAAQEIGAALAMELARRGGHLALVDRDRTGLAAVADAAVWSGIRVSEHCLDIARAGAIAALPKSAGPAKAALQEKGISHE